jgi:lipoprotein signal peptidase
MSFFFMVLCIGFAFSTGKDQGYYNFLWISMSLIFAGLAIYTHKRIENVTTRDGEGR